MTAVGAIVGWAMRGQRSQAEKDAVSAGWQDQLNAQRSEHSRLTDQNKDLMEQVSQYQASNLDAKNRSKELSLALKEALAKRDALQREIKDIRGNLDILMNEREQLESDISIKDEHVADTQRKNARIAKLQLELEKWQNRLPPLIEKFRQRNDAANDLESELAKAHNRIAELEEAVDPDQTRVEPVCDPDSLTNGRDASNEAIEAVEDNLAAQEPSNGSRDKLQDIKGVGPSIEKTLNEMGIFRFRQIAEMSEYDIDRVANRLKGFRSRIYREDWIGQARELRDQKDSG